MKERNKTQRKEIYDWGNEKEKNKTQRKETMMRERKKNKRLRKEICERAMKRRNKNTQKGRHEEMRIYKR